MSSEIYTDKQKAIEITYHNSELKQVKIINADIIDWDGLKHDIPYYSEDIDNKLFKKKK